MRLRESLLDEAGGPLKRFALKRLIGDRDARGIIRLLRERYRPKDVLVQQQKVARVAARCRETRGGPKSRDASPAIGLPRGC